jgi:hypothetical protein
MNPRYIGNDVLCNIRLGHSLEANRSVRRNHNFGQLSDQLLTHTLRQFCLASGVSLHERRDV